ncbi:MAG TPA: hypothetical protein VFR81_17495, partial [Longimicrobium sp.]|nr:hypothetical protein [Longimicrobium sp.]
DGALSGAVRHGAHLPGEHAAWDARGSAGIAPFTDARPPSEDVRREAPDLGSGVLPLCLRRLPTPHPVRVREGDGRRPLGVELQVLERDVLGPDARSFPPSMWKTSSEGPERISGAWWEGGSAREYWRVASPDGWLGLFFRDAATGEWYLEGWYD